MLNNISNPKNYNEIKEKWKDNPDALNFINLIEKTFDITKEMITQIEQKVLEKIREKTIDRNEYIPKIDEDFCEYFSKVNAEKDRIQVIDEYIEQTIHDKEHLEEELYHNDEVLGDHINKYEPEEDYESFYPTKFDNYRRSDSEYEPEEDYESFCPAKFDNYRHGNDYNEPYEADNGYDYEDDNYKD